MADIHVEIKNLPQIKAAFLRSPRLMTKNLNLAIAKSVLQVGRESRINTPVDTGRLRASHYERLQNLRGEIGTKTNYDVFVHDGTSRMRARPYLRKAVDSSQRVIDQNFTDAVQTTLDEIGNAT